MAHQMAVVSYLHEFVGALPEEQFMEQVLTALRIEERPMYT